MTKQALITISAIEFANRFTRSVKEQGQRFTWFLGAGCSVTSGIPATSGLVKRWLAELFDMQGRPSADFDSWCQSEFAKFEPSNPGALYADVFERRHPAPMERQREIEVICSRGYPAYGYATFAQLLSIDGIGHLCNTILTTNFDDLIADAIYLYGDAQKRPQVITHEALARYARISSPRPTIIKLHWDAHLDPKNLRLETREIKIDVARQIYPFLQDSALVFIGYGGNDESILGFLHACPTPALAPQIYWVGERDPSSLFRDWLIERDALRVHHTDFDRLMHLLRGPLSISHPEERHWNKAKESYYSQHRDFELEVRQQPASEEKAALQQVSSEVRASLPDEWRLLEDAQALEKNAGEMAARAAFEAALSSYPESAVLTAEYARFLSVRRTDPDLAQNLYERSLKADGSNANVVGNYATFFRDVRKDFNEAEKMYKRGLALDPNNFHCLTGYATFRYRIREDSNAANAQFKRALKANPENTKVLMRYALFLWHSQKDFDAAETVFKRAIEAEGMQSGDFSTYAVFLDDVRKDTRAAGTYHKLALKLEPNDADALANYGRHLIAVGRTSEGRKLARRAAMLAGDKNPTNLEALIYLFATDTKAKKRLSELKAVISQGVVTQDWDFGSVVRVAEENGHANIALLRDLTAVANSKIPISALDQYPDWSAA